MLDQLHQEQSTIIESQRIIIAQLEAKVNYYLDKVIKQNDLRLKKYDEDYSDSEFLRITYKEVV